MNLRQSPDKLALLIVILGMILTNFLYSAWNDPKRVIIHDVKMYYAYLPALFIERDISMSFRYKKPDIYQDKIWGETFDGQKVAGKMTMGVAILAMPSFLLAHGLAEPLGYPADGYSVPYRFALVFSSLIFVSLGFWFLIKLLRKYFDRFAVALTIIAVGLGTNLYYYSTIEAPMSHAYSFFLFSVFLWSLDTWLREPSWKFLMLLAFSAGLITLVRPVNIFILILILLWQTGSLKVLRSRMEFLFKNWRQLAVLVIIIFLTFLPQALYWKYITGSYFYYSYGDERFFFNDPAFLQGLFSYRKGWLLYTPVMLFALSGLFFLYKKNRGLFWPVLIFMVINLYVAWSWWCWWYGGSFGQRALIESYAILAVPFAACIEFMSEQKKIWRYLTFTFLAALIALNVFQSFQYTKGIIHWDSMSSNAYWRLYFRTSVSPALYEQIEPPDYEAALKGDR